MGMACEALIGAGGAPVTVRPHHYWWVGPLQAGAGVAVEVDHALTGVGHPAQAKSRASTTGEVSILARALTQEGTASRRF